MIVISITWLWLLLSFYGFAVIGYHFPLLTSVAGVYAETLIWWLDSLVFKIGVVAAVLGTAQALTRLIRDIGSLRATRIILGNTTVGFGLGYLMSVLPLTI